MTVKDGDEFAFYSLIKENMTIESIKADCMTAFNKIKKVNPLWIDFESNLVDFLGYTLKASIHRPEIVDATIDLRYGNTPTEDNNKATI